MMYGSYKVKHPYMGMKFWQGHLMNKLTVIHRLDTTLLLQLLTRAQLRCESQQWCIALQLSAPL